MQHTENISAFQKLKNTTQPRSMVFTTTGLDVIRSRLRQAQADYPLKTVFWDAATGEIYIEETDPTSRKEYPNIHGCWGEGVSYSTVRKVLNY